MKTLLFVAAGAALAWYAANEAIKGGADIPGAGGSSPYGMLLYPLAGAVGGFIFARTI